MTEDEFTAFQRHERYSALTALLQRCMRRFRLAGDLLGIDSPVFKRIREAQLSGGVQLTQLYPAWTVICERYREERFDPQSSLFKDHDDEAIERWGEFLHWQLFPLLLRDDEFVRNVLRATGLLPCRTKDKPATALCQHLEEMNLPFSPPVWDDAENEWM